VDAEFEQAQREVEREFAALRKLLDAPTPRAERLAEIKAAVDTEARWLRSQRRFRRLRPWVGVAAAVLLMASLSLPSVWQPSRPIVAPGDDAETVFVDWVEALEESGEQLTWLLEEDWLLDIRRPGLEDDGQSGSPLDALEGSFEAFEQVLGA
jgi:hypothetical protein